MLTSPVVERVVIEHAVVKELDAATSNVPVHIGVPLVTVPTQVGLLIVALWRQEGKIREREISNRQLRVWMPNSLMRL